MADSTPRATASSWQEYHTAWQSYYQEYFKRYYDSHLQQAQVQAALQAEQNPTSKHEDTHFVTPEQAVEDIRSDLRSKIRARARGVRKNRHFVPVMAALLVMMTFLLLQYNRVVFAHVSAYVRPGEISPNNIIIDPSQNVEVSNEARLIIPKINVDAPVVYDNTMGSNQQQTHDLQMEAMEKGVAWFGIPGADSNPGQYGNTVLSGHSSNGFFDDGNYKFLFALLDKVSIGDVIYTNYKGTRYTYSVTERKVVEPSNTGALLGYDDKPVLTLITCTPLGTAEKRLLVIAEQISPSPVDAEAAPEKSGGERAAPIPGPSPTLFQRVFGNE
jgi:sortase A